MQKVYKLKKNIIIVVVVVLSWIVISNLKNYARNQTESLNEIAKVEAQIFLKELSELNDLFMEIKVDSNNYETKFKLMKQLRQIDFAKNEIDTILEIKCFKINNYYVELKHVTKDSLNLSQLETIDTYLNHINLLSKNYNHSVKKHNVFMGSLPNYYLIEKVKREKLPYFSIQFNQENLDPSKYKMRFDKYMETGHDRFLKP